MSKKQAIFLRLEVLGKRIEKLEARLPEEDVSLLDGVMLTDILRKRLKDREQFSYKSLEDMEIGDILAGRIPGENGFYKWVVMSEDFGEFKLLQYQCLSEKLMGTSTIRVFSLLDMKNHSMRIVGEI